MIENLGLIIIFTVMFFGLVFAHVSGKQPWTQREVNWYAERGWL